VQDLRAVLAGRADDEHAAVDGCGQHPRRLVETGNRRAIDDDGPAPRPGELGTGEEAPAPDRRRGVEDATVRPQQLGERLAALDEIARRPAQRAVAAHEGRDVLRTRAQLLVERPVEVRGAAGVDEGRGDREHDGRRAGERDREPEADREAPHRSGSRRR